MNRFASVFLSVLMLAAVVRVRAAEKPERFIADSSAKKFSAEASATVASHRSPGKAVLLSLLVPGAGEYYAGSHGYLPLFLTSEVLAWGALFANHAYFRHLVREYKTFAYGHAGIAPGGKPDRFWTDIGKYDNIYDYNSQRERERLFDELYTLSPENIWQWDSHANRLKYDGKRLHANDIDNQRVYFQLAIVLNHLISGINALRLARQHNRQITQPKVGFQFDTYRENDWSHYVGVNFNIRF